MYAMNGTMTMINEALLKQNKPLLGHSNKASFFSYCNKLIYFPIKPLLVAY